VRATANDLKVFVFIGQRPASQPLADHLKQVIGQVGEIAECEMLDLPIVPMGVAEQVRDLDFSLVPLGDRGDMNRSFRFHARCIRPPTKSRNPHNGLHGWLHAF
jgi:hypothetical protein